MEISGDVTDAGRTDDEQGKIGLLSLWMLDAEFRKYKLVRQWVSTITHVDFEVISQRVNRGPEQQQSCSVWALI